ncbi:hypothetical protein OQA88_190 [Cercophora sp. LCS_1]
MLQWISLVLLFVGSIRFVSADCECGYSYRLDRNSSSREYVFTEATESNFARRHEEDIGDDTDWARQAFNLSAQLARGEYGEMFDVRNIGLGSQEEGLVLTVGSTTVQAMVPVAEIATRRLDMLWGTFRASIKITDVPGTCTAFFWYLNDTQEIDMEFLSKDFNASNSSYPVNLVLQSREAALMGFDAATTGDFKKVYLPFNPTTEFHEYRIDYLPGEVLFYADGEVLAQMDGPAVPTESGHLVLRHWSNGNRLWSGGPPTTDAAMEVKYVKAYFNSSSEQRGQDWAGRCKNAGAPNAVCKIPAVTRRDISAGDWFFSEKGNMTNNQTVYGLNGCSQRRISGSAVWALILAWAWALML